MFLAKAQFLSKPWHVILSVVSKSASMCANTAIDNNIQHQTAEELFRTHFWASVAARASKRATEIPSFVIKANVNEAIVDKSFSRDESEEAMKAEALRKCAREDLLKHFRMNAASRSAKRGDGFLSNEFSLGLTHLLTAENNADSDSHLVRANSIEFQMASSRNAREEFHNHFWKSHQSRKDFSNKLQNEAHSTFQDRSGSSSKLIQTKPSPTSIPHPPKHRQHHHHLFHHHRLPVPSKLSDVYLEFRNIDHHHHPHRTPNHYHPHHGPRAIALTETCPPFKIIDVNRAWIDLCGYTREQAVGSTLKALLQGPETNIQLAKELSSSLVKDAKKNCLSNSIEGNIVEHEAVLINYRSDGRRFRNHVRVGPLRDEITGETTHFVGVFKMLSDENDGLYYSNV